MTENERIKKLAKKLVLWNRNELDDLNNAFYELWKLFEPEALKQWNGQEAPNWCSGDSS